MNSIVSIRSLLSVAIASALYATSPLVQADQPDPYRRPDNSWISISGTVVSPTADRFMLDYGSGVITVEMDDWDSYGEAHQLMDGDKVRVFGRVDDDLFELASIEAGSVYVENLNTFFHANATDEEGAALPVTYWTTYAPSMGSDTTLAGTVEKVNADDGEFVVDLAGTDITVETAELGYNPLDKNGYQQIEKGDLVSVTGQMDYDFIDGRVFVADFITTVVDRKSS